MVTSHHISVGFPSFCDKCRLIFMPIGRSWVLAELDTTLISPSAACAQQGSICKIIQYSVVYYVKSGPSTTADKDN